MNTLPFPTPDSEIIDSREVIDALTLPFNGLDPEQRGLAAALVDLAEQGETLEDWAHGVTLIRDDYFTRYAEEYAIDCGLVDPAALWPACYIDWERAAADLRMDYTPLQYGTVTYWAR